MNFTPAHLQSTPFAVLYSYKLVSEADFLGELLQQIDAKSAAALIEALVLLRRLDIHPATKTAFVNPAEASKLASDAREFAIIITQSYFQWHSNNNDKIIFIYIAYMCVHVHIHQFINIY